MLAAILGLVAALLPAPAGAAAQCDFDVFTGKVVVTASGPVPPTALTLGENGQILVNGATCQSVTGDVAKVDNVDQIDLVGSTADEIFVIELREAHFSPGMTDELTGKDEIEFVANLGEGTDTLQVDGGPLDNKIHAGSAGINLNGDDDPDVTFGGADVLLLRGEIGVDEITATGDPVTGLPVVLPVVLRGGSSKDVLKGGPMNDMILGERGHDLMVGGAGDDVFRGMAGDDTLSYSSSPLPVNVDLSKSRATGEGTDDTGVVEILKGTSFDDRVVSAPFKTTVYAGRGNDALFGDSNVDRLYGSKGRDLLSGDLRRDYLKGGPGADRLTGGPFVDQLVGGEGRDRCRVDKNTDDKKSCEGRIPRSLSDPGRIHVIVANLKEMDPDNRDHITGEPRRDLARKGELVNFAERLAGELHVVPDVLLFSEAVSVSTRTTAKLLSREFKMPFGTAIAPTKLYIGNSTRRANKRNTSVVINKRTMERVGKGGYVTVKQPRGEQREGTLPTSQDEAHVLLREKASGKKVAVMSVHLLSGRKFRSRDIARHRKGVWAEQLMTFFHNKYPDAPIKVVGGEFNERRCTARVETNDCSGRRPNSTSTITPLWRAMTRDPYNYKDAVFEHNSHRPWDISRASPKLTNRGGKRIDYIFAKPAVHSGWHDLAYKTRMFSRGYISDHRFISSVVGLPD